jgi:hypothetical protein
MKIMKWLAAGSAVAASTYGAYAGITWLRYGRPRPAQGTEVDPLLDSFMPRYDICERHSATVNAPPDVALAAAKEVDLNDSRIIRAIFKGRELLLRSKPSASTKARGLYLGMQELGWGVLAETDKEIVFGAVTEPWHKNPAFRALWPEEFETFAEPGHVKITWTLRVDANPDGTSTFRTETRAVATDPESRAQFRRYWAFLSPGVTVIRRAILPAVEAAADASWKLPGDDIIAAPAAQFTHATMIAAPPKDVWPWLVQMGCQRGGWYSWDRLDNAGEHSATRIIPELQHIDVGDVLPWRPTGDNGFVVLRVEPERCLVLGSSTSKFDGTWAFVLEPGENGTTRLVTRYRATFADSESVAGKTIRKHWMGALHAFMERKQLRTIKDHAEHMHS